MMFNSLLFRIISVTIIMIGVLVIWHQTTIRESDGEAVVGITDFTAHTKDSGIILLWETSQETKSYDMELHIEADGVDKTVPVKKTSSYEFTEGVHGERYLFSLEIKDPNGMVIDEKVQCAMFLNYDELPDLPLVTITTINNEEPVYEQAEKPEGAMGGSITKNDYVTGIMTVTRGGVACAVSDMKIKVRGNKSAFSDKKPYKIKLDKKLDLLERGEDEYKSKNWLLIKGATSLKTTVGLEVASYCGIEWEPKYEYVNVILNGDWKGCYLLIESVEKRKGRCDIDNSGYLIENDAYWWNEEDYYFKTEHLGEKVGYTFTYPKTEDLTDASVTKIQGYISDFEAALYDGTEDYANYIDVDSFAAWLLTHDILGTKDAYGSNMYLYKYDFNDENPTSTKLKMGPVWDFDTCFVQEGAWAGIHRSKAFYFEQLFTYQSFTESYQSRWRQVADSITTDVQRTLEELYANQGEAIQESRELDADRWGTPAINLQEEIGQVLDWMTIRTAWLNENIPNIDTADN